MPAGVPSVIQTPNLPSASAAVKPALDPNDSRPAGPILKTGSGFRPLTASSRVPAAVPSDTQSWSCDDASRAANTSLPPSEAIEKICDHEGEEPSTASFVVPAAVPSDR